jgi:hypothetical protein
MITQFPTPQPDELFYSLCARYSDRVQYPNKEAVNVELFGSRGIAASMDLPRHLHRFEANLPQYHALTADRVIDEYTLFPYYCPFLPANRAELLRCQMKASDDSSVHKTSGITASTIRTFDCLRYCPVCVKEERDNSEPCYWRRLHQVPGVEVCALHSVFLETSGARVRNRVNSAEYTSAESAVLPIVPRPLDLSNPDHGSLVSIARDSEWLLEQRGLVPGFKALHDSYMKVLDERGLVSLKDKIRLKEMIPQFADYYSAALLKTLQCEFDVRKGNNWPSRIVKHLNQGKTNHPLRHLLLIQVLGHTAESFFTALAAPKRAARPSPNAFGRGPWPCLNPACKFYKRLVIKTLQLAPHYYIKGVMTGTFGCKCGFIYLRKDVGESAKNSFRYHQVKSHGPVWEAKLKALWNDLSLSINAIAPQLGAAHNSVIYHATRLGLSFPRKGPGSKIAKVRPNFRQWVQNLSHEQSPSRKSALLRSNRKRWLTTREENPKATRTQLQQTILPDVYRWLRRHDYVWLKSHMPPPFKRIGSARRVDWPSRDIQYAEEVRISAARLKNEPGHPVRVTKQAIGRDIDRTAVLSNPKLRKNIPLTFKALDEVVETRVEFSIRRLRWATALFRQEGVIPSFSTLAQRAGINWDIWYLPEVKIEIEAVLAALRDNSLGIEVEAA